METLKDATVKSFNSVKDVAEAHLHHAGEVETLVHVRASTLQEEYELRQNAAAAAIKKTESEISRIHGVLDKSRAKALRSHEELSSGRTFSGYAISVLSDDNFN
jgi:hypothetical protein